MNDPALTHTYTLHMQNVQVINTTGPQPIVYGEFMHSDGKGPEGKWPTVLIYGHYDVQPEDPVDSLKTQWTCGHMYLLCAAATVMYFFSYQEQPPQVKVLSNRTVLVGGT
eukprot:1161446-Pelagomonas_calceolata.AAC.2